MGLKRFKQTVSKITRHCIFCLALLVARFLPIRIGYFLSECIAVAVFLFSAKYRNIVVNNLRRVLGVAVDEVNLYKKVGDVFKNNAKNYFDLIRFSQSKFESLEGVTLKGYHNLKKAIGIGKGTIIVTAHIGTMELGAQFLASRGIEVAVFVEPFDSNPALLRIAKLRQRNKIKLLPNSIRSVKDGMQVLHNGGTLALVCDRTIRGKGLKVKFFGTETVLPVGAINLALRTGATVIPVFAVRKDNNRCAIHIEHPIELVTNGDQHELLKANMERLVAVMENYIRKYPEQWMVMSPVWDNQAVGKNLEMRVSVKVKPKFKLIGRLTPLPVVCGLISSSGVWLLLATNEYFMGLFWFGGGLAGLFLYRIRSRRCLTSDACKKRENNNH